MKVVFGNIESDEIEVKDYVKIVHHNRDKKGRCFMIKQLNKFLKTEITEKDCKNKIIFFIPQNEDERLLCCKFNKFPFRDDDLIIEQIILERARLKALDCLEYFNLQFKSPYSESYYDCDNKTWNYTQEGCLRLSDHWNFTDRMGDLHCKIKDTTTYINKWILAEYKNGFYEILEVF